MGIYSSGKARGIRIYRFKNRLIDDTVEVLFERTYDAEMTPEQIAEAKTFYNVGENKDLRIEIYVGCSSTYEPAGSAPFMSWMPVTADYLA
jgi:hypothetical protein